MTLPAAATDAAALPQPAPEEASAPPLAPLAMPKQVLTHPPGSLRRAIALRLGRFLPGVGRTG